MLGIVDAIVTRDGAYLFAACNIDDTFVMFSRNTETGALTYPGFEKDGVDGVDGLDAALGITQSPCGNFIFTLSYFDKMVACFRLN